MLTETTGACRGARRGARPVVVGRRGIDHRPERRKRRRPRAQITLTPAEEAADQGRQVHRRARLARDERIHQRRRPGRPGRVRAARHRRWSRRPTPASTPREQKADVETVLAKKPSIILSLPVDPATAAAVYRPGARRRREARLRRQLRRPATCRARTMSRSSPTISSRWARRPADAMAAALGGKGKVGYIFHDADFYVTNQRDGAFKETIESDYPDMKIVAERAWPTRRRARRSPRRCMTQEPRPRRHLCHLGRAGAERARGAAQRPATRHTKIVTLDLNEPAALDMVKGGNVAAIVADEAYAIGATLARAAAASLIGKKLEPFFVVDAHRGHQGQHQGGLDQVAAQRAAGHARRGEAEPMARRSWRPSRRLRARASTAAIRRLCRLPR